MPYRLLTLVAVSLSPVLAIAGEDLDAPFAALGELPAPTVTSFNYKLSLKGIPMQSSVRLGRKTGVSTNPTILQFWAESPERIPGSGPMRAIAGKTTVGDGLVDFSANQEWITNGMPEYPPSKPSAMFRSEIRRLLLVNDEVRLRLRFKDATSHYLVRYEDGAGLRLVPLDVSEGNQIEKDLIKDFRVLNVAIGDATWHCNGLTTWATVGNSILWSTDVAMSGQPETIRVVGNVLFITTSAKHSFFIRKDTGELAFYDKSVLPGIDPMQEVLSLGRANMGTFVPKRSLARFIHACVALNDKRSIPFLIDCIEGGDSVPVRAMALAALEKYNGNPAFWEARGPGSGEGLLWRRVKTKADRQAEMTKWQKLFAEHLD